MQETGATLRVVVDDLGAAQALAGSGLHVWLKVDCGYHRAGVDPASPYALAVAGELARERGLTFDGILSHSGHAYRTKSREEAAHVAEAERSVMAGVVRRLPPPGVAPPEGPVGATPALGAPPHFSRVPPPRPPPTTFPPPPLRFVP